MPMPVDPSLNAQLVLAAGANPINWGLTFDVRRGPDGLLYLTAGNGVWRLDESTGALNLFATTPLYAYQIDWTSDGTAWVADYYDGVFAFDSNGAQLAQVPVPGGLIGLVVNDQDRVFTNSHLDGTMYEVDRFTGAVSTYALFPFNPLYDRPGCVRLYGMSEDATGAIMASDLGCDHTVYRQYGNADARPVTDRFQAVFTPPSAYGFYFQTHAADGRSWYSAYPGEVWERDAAGTISMYATGIVNNGGAGLFWDESRGSLYIIDSAGLWRIDDAGSPPAGPTVTWSGTCPGAMTMQMTGFTPNGPLTVLSSTNAGAVTVPSGPCAGATSGLGMPGIRVRAQLTADAIGDRSLNVNLPPNICSNHYVQVLDTATCTFSNVTTP